MLLDQYKCESGRIVKELVKRYDTAPSEACLTAAKAVMTRRTTKGFKSALLSGLVVGALCERGTRGKDAAERVLYFLSTMQDLPQYRSK